MLIAPAAAFSDLSAKCCSTSVGAGKNEAIQRFEKGAGSFGQDPTGLSYVTSVFLICEAAGEKCEKMRVFRHPEACDPQLYHSSSLSARKKEVFETAG